MRKIKNLLTTLLCCVAMFALGQENSKTESVSLSVVVKNCDDAFLLINEREMYRPMQSFKCPDGKLEKQTFNIPAGYYNLLLVRETTPVYLKPGYNLSVSLDYEKFDETIKYTGEGSEENNYLAAKLLLHDKHADMQHYSYFAKLNEKEFLHFADSVYQLEKDLLESRKNQISPEFYAIESQHIYITYASRLVSYPLSHRALINQRDFTVSDDYPNAFENINITDDYMVEVPQFARFTLDYLGSELKSMIEADSTLSYSKSYVDLIDSKISNQILKEEVARYFGWYFLKMMDEKEYCSEKLLAMLTKPEYKQPIIEIMKNEEKLAPGNQSPSFEFKNMKGKKVKLSDFEGKLVYIDVWATWCSPCIKEIPKLVELEKEFKGKDIVFVSICKQSPKAAWKRIVEEYKMEGVLLFGPDNSNSFYQAYDITGVPRFILIDRDGKIIDARAMRPSSEDIVDYLNEKLKE